jgi:hypothetical protein
MAQLRYRFSVLGRYVSPKDDNETHVNLTVAAGAGDNLVYCGTLTMTEWEWRVMLSALKRSGLEVKVDDRTRLPRSA